MLIYKMTKSIFCALLGFTVFLFAGCSSGSSDSDVGSYLSITSLSPASGSAIAQGSTITADLDYVIADRDSSKTYIVTIWFSTTDGGSSREVNTVKELTDDQGEVSFSYTVNGEFTNTDYEHPFKIEYAIHAYDKTQSVNDVDWGTSFVAGSDIITYTIDTSAE